MNPPEITIICSVFGSLETTRKCLDSWFPLPENWKMIIYNNKISDIDGTTLYLRKKINDCDFKLIEDGYTRRHPAAIKLLLNQTTTKWVLLIDSDVLLLDKNFFKMAEDLIINNKFEVYGRIHNRLNTDFSDKKTIGDALERTNHLYLLRLHSCFVLFNHDSVKRWNADFDDINIKGKVSVWSEESKRISDTTEMEVFGDTGWKLFWHAMIRDSFGRLDDAVVNCYLHLNNASCRWLKEITNKKFDPKWWQ